MFEDKYGRTLTATSSIQPPRFHGHVIVARTKTLSVIFQNPFRTPVYVTYSSLGLVQSRIHIIRLFFKYGLVSNRNTRLWLCPARFKEVHPAVLH